MLNFENQDFTPILSYVALSRVQAIEYVIFETIVLQDRFSTVLLLVV